MMLRLTRDAFARANHFIRLHARSLDRALFEYHFEAGASTAVLDELSQYQNENGGFGNWIESDFALKASSPAATTVAFEYLREVNASTGGMIVRRAVDYLLATFQRDEGRWYAVPRAVNDEPHAPWWHCDEKSGRCPIDRCLGNPSAEIVGHLNRYRELIPVDFLDQLTESFIGHLHALPDECDSMHEILCYVRMAESLPPNDREQCLDKLRRLVRGATELEAGRWSEYCASPLFFAGTPDSPFADLFPAELEANLDYLIRGQNGDGSWSPNWSWGQYDEAWLEARRRWSGCLTVRNLKILSDFGLIDR